MQSILTAFLYLPVITATNMNNCYKICLFALCLMGIYKAGAQTELTYYTSMGNFKVMLTDTLTPITVDSFKARVSRKFYDGLLFHRVIDNFVIQGGDPLGNGTGGPGYATPDEYHPSLKNVAGSLAMANSGANTNGSQYYVNLVNNASLNNRYTVFGMVTTGFSVVQAIGQVPTNPSNNKPVTNVYTDSIRITQQPGPTLIPAINTAGGANLYPNPCRGAFTISLPALETKVEVINTQGQVIYHNSARGFLRIDLGSQPAGLYLVRLTNAAGSIQSRLMVQ